MSVEHVDISKKKMQPKFFRNGLMTVAFLSTMTGAVKGVVDINHYLKSGKPVAKTITAQQAQQENDPNLLIDMGLFMGGLAVLGGAAESEEEKKKNKDISIMDKIIMNSKKGLTIG